MDKEQKATRDFKLAFDQTVNYAPTIPSEKDRKLCFRLIQDELEEFREASGINEAVELKPDIVLVADALADLVYVVKGAAVTWGIDLEPIFNEVHRSNMTKIGGHKDELGKWVKPESYSKAELEPIIQKQMKERA